MTSQNEKKPIEARRQRDAEATTAPPRAQPSTVAAGQADDAPALGAFRDYELVQQIGSGGMGVVYLAHHKTLGRTVALKVILQGRFAHPEQLRRFINEARAAAAFDHPNIVPVYEFGEHEGRHFIAMGYIDGGSLSERVNDGPLAAREAAEIVQDVAAAVHHAHERGVIHRDLKPGNVLLASDGTPRICDFGLARIVDDQDQHTATGQPIGTPSYMAPEQAAGRPDAVGVHSDVYGLGAILYCLLTGRPPFQSSTAINTLDQVVRMEPVAPRRLNPAIDRDVETICLQCLQKDPKKRYASAAALGDDLRRYLDGRPVKARPVGAIARTWRWCHRNPTVAASLTAVAVSLLVAAVVGWVANVRTSRALVREQIALQNERRQKENLGRLLRDTGQVVKDDALPRAAALIVQARPAEAIASLHAAQAIFKLLAERDPSSAEWATYRAAVNGLLGQASRDSMRLEEAEIAFEESERGWLGVARLQPKNAFNWSGYAMAISDLAGVQQGRGRPDDALKTFDRGLAVWPTDPDAMPQNSEQRDRWLLLSQNKAELLCRLKRPGEAVQALQQAEQRFANHAEQLFGIARGWSRCAAAVTGKDEQETFLRGALGALKRAVQAGFGDLRRLEESPEIEVLRGREELRRIVERLKQSP